MGIKIDRLLGRPVKESISTYEFKPVNLIRKCSKCKKRTEHSQHGFRGHNYRLKCEVCKTLNYEEDELE
jgi:hypothetical protein